MIKTKEYLIIPLINRLYRVINRKTDDEYDVDIQKPYCSCLKYKYTKKKAGKKPKCQHILICEGIKNE